MKPTHIVPVVAALTLGFSGVTFAENAMGTATDSAGTSPQAASQVKTVTGAVTKVDTLNNTVQVKENSGMVRTVTLDQNAVVTRSSGEGADINNLKVGDVVSIKIAPSRTPGS